MVANGRMLDEAVYVESMYEKLLRVSSKANE